MNQKKPTVDFSVKGKEHAEAGFIFVDKPDGPTSATIVSKLKRALLDNGVTSKHTKIGHGGTLDPMATGLLVVLLGRATRLADYALHAGKSYSGLIKLGFSTDTDDITGAQVGESCTVPALNGAILTAVAKKFTGTIMQRPPVFSALKIAGQRAYDLARAGKSVELAEREVTIAECKLELYSPNEIKFFIQSSGGTYIRSLARDIGAELGCGGTLSTLRRESSGRFLVDEAMPWREAESGLPSEARIQPWWELLPEAKRFLVDADVSDRLAAGDQRAFLGLPGRDKAGRDINYVNGELMIYCVGDRPHGVVRGCARGLELVLHVGDARQLKA